MLKILVGSVLSPLLRLARQVMADQRGAVSLVYSAALVTMLLALGAGLDLTNTLQVKAQLDQAADAAAVACGEYWQATMAAGAATATTSTEFGNLLSATDTQAAQLATSTFAAQAAQLASVVTGTPSAKVTTGTAISAAGASAQCAVNYSAQNPTYLMRLAHINTVPMTGSAVSNVELAPYVEVFLILDTSASMMVGSTPGDQSKVATWVSNNASQVFCSGCDTSPCAFACHEEPSGQNFLVSDMLAGEANAHTAQAITRFDVMRLALNNDPSASFCTSTVPSSWKAKPSPVYCAANLATAFNQPALSSFGEGLFAYIRDTYSASGERANLNTFTYTLYGFNSGINGNEPPSGIFTQDQTDQSQTVVAQTSSLATVAAGVNALTIGLNTHLMPPMKFGYSKTSNSVLQDLQTIVGTTGPNPGLTASNPLKYVIIITDGMSSDRNWNWCDPNNTGEVTGCNNDPWPSSTSTASSTSATAATTAPVTANPTVATVCNNWSGAAPTFDGTAIWQGSTGECADSSYQPGFWNTPNSPTFQPNPASTNNLTLHYASTIDSSYCATMKANGGSPGPSLTLANGTTISGVTIAVLETPYVPMTGQDPLNYPYEGGVQQIIYPAGDPATFPGSYPPGPHGETMSALSKALWQCASGDDYYFQAASDQQIANGFITLFGNFIGQFVHLSQ